MLTILRLSSISATLAHILFFIAFYNHTPYLLCVFDSTSCASASISIKTKPTAMAQTFSQGDVASHNKGDSLWIIVDDDVYDLTKFQDDHPGMSPMHR